jgi:ribonuclease VapC
LIVVDTSALMAIVLDEHCAEDCRTALLDEARLVISAATVAEALIVARRRGRAEDMETLIGGLGFEVAPVTHAQARRLAASYHRWGKGMDWAGLDFGDCFAYALAQELRCKLLFVGNDFAKTDAAPALPS